MRPDLTRNVPLFVRVGRVCDKLMNRFGYTHAESFGFVNNARRKHGRDPLTLAEFDELLREHDRLADHYGR